MFETTLDRRALAEVYTILRALEESTLKKIPSNIVDAIRYNTASICIPPSFVKRAKEAGGEK